MEYINEPVDTKESVYQTALRMSFRNGREMTFKAKDLLYILKKCWTSDKRSTSKHKYTPGWRWAVIGVGQHRNIVVGESAKEALDEFYKWIKRAYKE